MTEARDYVIRHGKPDDAVVGEIVRRIVETAQPDRIMLFGSAARADMGPHSDLDFLVIKSGEYDRARLEGDLYVAMNGIGIATDILLVTPEQVERYAYAKFLVIHSALTDGVELYTRATPSS